MYVNWLWFSVHSFCFTYFYIVDVLFEEPLYECLKYCTFLYLSISRLLSLKINICKRFPFFCDISVNIVQNCLANKFFFLSSFISLDIAMQFVLVLCAKDESVLDQVKKILGINLKFLFSASLSAVSNNRKHGQ